MCVINDLSGLLLLFGRVLLLFGRVLLLFGIRHLWLIHRHQLLIRTSRYHGDTFGESHLPPFRLPRGIVWLVCHVFYRCLYLSQIKRQISAFIFESISVYYRCG